MGVWDTSESKSLILRNPSSFISLSWAQASWFEALPACTPYVYPPSLTLPGATLLLCPAGTGALFNQSHWKVTFSRAGAECNLALFPWCREGTQEIFTEWTDLLSAAESVFLTHPALYPQE